MTADRSDIATAGSVLDLQKRWFGEVQHRSYRTGSLPPVGSSQSKVTEQTDQNNEGNGNPEQQ